MAITQATGWVAVYKNDDGTHEAEPVAVWQEVREYDIEEGRQGSKKAGRESWGVVGLVDCGGYLDDAEQTKGFEFYALATEWQAILKAREGDK